MIDNSTVHKLLRKKFFTSFFTWNGETYQGHHAPIITMELWNRVQDVLDEKNIGKHQRGKHEFAFSKLISCARCGCAVVAEIKKQKYIYYHPTAWVRRCQLDPASCRRQNVREEKIEQTFHDLLGRLRVDDQVRVMMRKALRDNKDDGNQEREGAIRRLRAEHDRLEKRLDALYTDKLDGEIDAEYHRKKSAQWREQIAQITDRITQY